MPATNLVDVCRQVLTPESIGAMSSNLHLDPHTVENAAEGAVPALLASLGAAVGRPGGDRQLADAMARVPQGSDDISGFAERGAFGSNGSNPLSGLLSSRTQDSLAHAIGQYAHIGDGDSKRLLGMLGPAVLGQLGRQRMSSGLDAIGLADMLSSQRRKIAGAIPQGLADQMTASGLGDALKDRPRTTTVSGVSPGVESTSRTQQSTYTRSEPPRVARTTTTHTPARRANNSWLYWLLGLAALAALAFWAIGNTANRDRGVTTPGGEERTTAPTTPGRDTTPAQPTTPDTAARTTTPGGATTPDRATTPGGVTTPGAAAAGSMTVGGVNVQNELSSSMDSLRSTLGGITDEASARAAMPNLQEATSQLERLGSLARQLPPEGRSQLASAVSSEMPAMERQFDRILAIPGASNVLRPVVEGLRSRFQAFSAT